MARTYSIISVPKIELEADVLGGIVVGIVGALMGENQAGLAAEWP